MYKLVVNELSKEKLINQYFFLIGGYLETMMENFLKQESFGLDAMGILFRSDLDEGDDEEELEEIEDNQILLVSEYPASKENEKAYYYYNEFYEYLKIFIDKNYKNNDKINSLLREIEVTFNL